MASARYTRIEPVVAALPARRTAFGVRPNAADVRPFTACRLRRVVVLIDDAELAGRTPARARRRRRWRRRDGRPAGTVDACCTERTARWDAADSADTGVRATGRVDARLSGWAAGRARCRSAPHLARWARTWGGNTLTVATGLLRAAIVSIATLAAIARRRPTNVGPIGRARVDAPAVGAGDGAVVRRRGAIGRGCAGQAATACANLIDGAPVAANAAVSGIGLEIAAPLAAALPGSGASFTFGFVARRVLFAFGAAG